MPHVKTVPGWAIPESQATPESVYHDRRRFLKQMGFLGLGALLPACDRPFAPSAPPQPADRSIPTQPPRAATPEALLPFPPTYAKLFPASPNTAYALDRDLTHEKQATTYNNFYEFSTSKSEVHKLVGKFRTHPWEIEIAGLCERPGVYDAYDLIAKMPLEERLYRFRCVEAWAMAVPWTGFPIKALLDHVGVKNEAAFLRLVTFMRPEEAPGFEKYENYPFPYYEAITLPEAMNELAILAAGIYGKPLPAQCGAPLRLVLPWKYGLKSIKSLVGIEFTAERPPTFWNDVNPREYSWHSNVEPDVPHPRWSQKKERMLGTGENRDTLLYNGYADYVAHLYA
ncbi:protein-methionine-sulfoxide reductase catalytic subunit MsrP [bacterium]|nr:protein-methionine-sulfoxide reductase catalytic subunit MsrP [bacterium]